MSAPLFSEPLVSAIAEAEKLVAAAPHIETEADLLEGLQYLAGCVAACTHMAFDYERDHPMLLSGTGPFTKMGLDNPDTLYFGTRVQPDRDYVVTGKRGTTTDLSFQLLGGEYTDDNVPASQAAFDDRELEIAADGSFEWQVRPTSPGQLVIREVYDDWSAAARHARDPAARHRRHRAAAADSRSNRKALLPQRESNSSTGSRPGCSFRSGSTSTSRSTRWSRRG